MTFIMRPSLKLTEVYIYRQAIDFRKSHRGLAAIAYSGSKLPPIPAECCHPFHFKAATESGEDCHPLVVTF